MHSLYLSHLVEIANEGRHALAINSRICAAFCVLPVYNQLLALEYTHAPAHVATNTLKKQVDCFNHRVVTLVTILSGLHKVSFGI